MNVLDYIQISMNVFLLLAVVVIWIRLNRPAKEDPRLSRGLQLLQSKISILEDLSDRTENQVKQMLKLLEKKGSQVQQAMMEARETIGLIEQSVHKSMEVAEIFEDKIPHEEIIERQSSKKYIEAARLAHAGLSVEEIAKRVSLDIAEIEFITKVNKDRLMFSEEDLPKWAKSDAPEVQTQDRRDTLSSSFGAPPEFEEDFEEAFASPDISLNKLEDLGKKFRQACADVDAEEEKKAEFGNKLKSGVSTAIHSVLQPIEDVKAALKNEIDDLSNKANSEDEQSYDWDSYIEEADRLENPSIDNAMDRIEAHTSSRLEDRLDFSSESVFQDNLETDMAIRDSEAVARDQDLSAPQEKAPRARANQFQVGIEDNALRPQRITEEEESRVINRKPKYDLVNRVTQRAKERIQSGQLKTKVKSSDSINELKSLDFPEIKVNPNDHLA